MAEHDIGVDAPNRMTEGGSSPDFSPLRVVLAAGIGTAVEWYDYLLYGFMAALVFSPLFFPGYSAEAGTVAAFATFAVGFVARPVGGLIMGHFGDIVGRKPMLVLSLVLMGAASFGLGLLPTYETIGLWAPILLVVLRLVQGLSAGGEWGGAVLLAVENAPPGKRTLYGSLPQAGQAVGLILANLSFIVLTLVVTHDQLLQWAWRIPFLASIVMVVIGLVIRVGVPESAEFRVSRQKSSTAALPVWSALRSRPGPIVLSVLTYAGASTLGYIFLTYTLSYGTKVVGYVDTTLLVLTMVGAVVWMSVMPVASAIADRFGRARVLIVGWVVLLVSSAALFPAMDTGSVAFTALVMVVLAAGVGITYGPIAALFSDIFSADVRYSGASVCFQVGSLVGGGFAPLVAAAIYSSWRTSTAITVYLVLVSLVGLVTMAVLVTRYDRAAATGSEVADVAQDVEALP